MALANALDHLSPTIERYGDLENSMSFKFGVYWQALPAVALATAFLFSVSDKGFGAEARGQTAVAGQPAILPAAVPLATFSVAVETDDKGLVAPSGLVFEDAAVGSDVDVANGVTMADSEVACLAKIIHHESANQPEAGQMAVAHVVLNRLASPRFPKSVCAIALQPGQFFNVYAYDPSGDSRWSHSLSIALQAMAGEGANVAPGALFFHAVGYKSSFFRSRLRVTQIAGHVFYR